MILYRVIYVRGGMLWKTSPYMSLEECKVEVKRFNALPFMDLERGAMTARVEEITVSN